MAGQALPIPVAKYDTVNEIQYLKVVIINLGSRDSCRVSGGYTSNDPYDLCHRALCSYNLLPCNCWFSSLAQCQLSSNGGNDRSGWTNKDILGRSKVKLLKRKFPKKKDHFINVTIIFLQPASIPHCDLWNIHASSIFRDGTVIDGIESSDPSLKYATHHANAWEEGDEIIVDLSSNPTDAIAVMSLIFNIL